MTAKKRKHKRGYHLKHKRKKVVHKKGYKRKKPKPYKHKRGYHLKHKRKPVVHKKGYKRKKPKPYKHKSGYHLKHPRRKSKRPVHRKTTRSQSRNRNRASGRMLKMHITKHRSSLTMRNTKHHAHHRINITRIRSARINAHRTSVRRHHK